MQTWHGLPSGMLGARATPASLIGCTSSAVSGYRRTPRDHWSGWLADAAQRAVGVVRKANRVTTAAVMTGCAAGVDHVGNLPSFVQVCLAGTRSPFEGQQPEPRPDLPVRVQPRSGLGAKPASPADDRKRRPVQDPPETDVPRPTCKTEAKASPPSPADYAAFSRSIGRALRARGADQHTVEDITQESFARLLPILGPLGADARLPWLLVTANNLFTDQHRRASTARRNRSELIELNRQPAQPHQVFRSVRSQMRSFASLTTWTKLTARTSYLTLTASQSLI